MSVSPRKVPEDVRQKLSFSIEAILGKRQDGSLVHSHKSCETESDSDRLSPVSESDDESITVPSHVPTLLRQKPKSCGSTGIAKGTGHADLGTATCKLDTKELWDKFNELGTEMIITKLGRRMFPTVRCSFHSLRSDCKYRVYMDIVPVDNKRYRYAYHRSSWLVAGKADPPLASRLYLHPDSPFTGEHLQKQSVSFEKVKLTNNAMDNGAHVILNSMHKYQPRVHVVLVKDATETFETSADLKDEVYQTFVFPETKFIAVTAYQNQLITKLKIDSNPFAKGFRDSSRLSDIERENVETLMRLQSYRQALPTGYELQHPFTESLLGRNNSDVLENDRVKCEPSTFFPLSSNYSSESILYRRAAMMYGPLAALPTLSYCTYLSSQMTSQSYALRSPPLEPTRLQLQNNMKKGVDLSTSHRFSPYSTKSKTVDVL